MVISIEKEHNVGPKSPLIEDGRQNIAWDLETNCRNNFFPGESEQISSGGTDFMWGTLTVCHLKYSECLVLSCGRWHELHY